MPLEHCKITVKGRVQGIFFRASTQKMASQLAIKGAVKNTPAGNVEIIAAGEKKAMQEFIKWCHKGPLAAKVTEVIVEPFTGSVDHTGFIIIRH